MTGAGYRGVYGTCSREKTIERSVFLSFAKRVEDEDAARFFLASLREQHPLATHICYGFIADKLGNLQRFSDDGEPQGTAGMPILGVIKNKELRETAVAVVRYFGGIKLGAGGLTRAYASSAQEVLSAAEIRLFAPCTIFTAGVEYADAERAIRFLERYEVTDRAFGEKVSFTVAVKDSDAAAFCTSFSDVLCGRGTLTEGEHTFRPFNIG